jgi:Kef-type K+ transport system membrane component KefB
MTMLTVGIFLAIRACGESQLAAPAVSRGSAPAAGGSHFDVMFHVLLAMATVIVAGRAVGFVLYFFRQPPVVGEIVAGILLGPSLLGWIAPDAYQFLLPQQAAPFLRVIAQLGVILYMFLVGLEFNAGILRKQGSTTLTISQSCILVPFLLGAGLAIWLYPRYSTGAVSFTVFALFVGVAMAVTAFPVLARILGERKMSRTKTGSLALACAAVGDVTAWCLLAFVVGAAQAKLRDAAATAAWTAAYIAFMWLAVRPGTARLMRWVDANPAASPHVVAAVFIALLLSALATEIIGVHAIFGAFLLGVVIPHDSRLAEEFLQKLEDVVGVLLLPAFFAFTGMRTQIGLVQGWEDALFLFAIIAAATIGKWGGAAVAGRATGLSWREAGVVGVLMNTRGLMELIVLNVGLDMNVLSPTLFAMMVLMAIITTMATGPLLDWMRASVE